MADALSAHDEALERFGGRKGVSDLDLIESAIARPYSGYYRSIASKGAALVQSVSGNHGFIDGNKRTALYLLDLLLSKSGYQIKEEYLDSMDDMIVDVVEHRLNIEELIIWLRNRIIPI